MDALQIELKLNEIMQQFCFQFGLDYKKISFSYELTEKELLAYNIFLSKELERILAESGSNFKKADKSVERHFRGYSLTAEIEKDGLHKMGEALANLKHGKADILSNYLRHNKDFLKLLFNAYGKIEKNPKLFGLMPIPKPDNIWRAWRARAGFKERFSDFVHECIHKTLGNNNIEFSSKTGGGMCPVDEGLCVFLHKKFGKHYRPSPQYEKYRWFFERLLKNVPENKIIWELESRYEIRKTPMKLVMAMRKYLGANQ